jgi:sugar lactone lactonase YvrE
MEVLTLLRCQPITLLLVFACAPALFGQTYTISTAVGAGPPANIVGTAASLPSGQPSYLAADSAGDVFFVDLNAVVKRSAATGMLTVVAGNGTTGYSGDSGPATSAQLNNPSGLAVDTDGTLYIADTGNYVIRKVSGGVITTYAGNGSVWPAGTACPNVTAANAEFNGLGGLALDSHSNLYIADGGANCVRKISGGMVTTVAGTGIFGDTGDGGPATAARVQDPAGIAVDSSGNIYLPTDNRVREVSAATGNINTVAGNNSGTVYGDGGPATSALLAGPLGVAVDSQGNLYFSDIGHNTVRKVTNGTISTYAGNYTLGAGFAGDGATATAAQLSSPWTIALDGGGNLYIADQGNVRIREVAGGTIETIVGNGLIGDDGPASQALLGFPAGLALDPSGNLYIADNQSLRVRKVAAATGSITTLAGNGASGASVTDGSPATSVALNSPSAVAADTNGNVFIANSFLGNVLRVSGGLIYNFAGNGTLGYSGDGALATNAEMGNIFGLATDPSNNLYLSDDLETDTTSQARIRIISNGIINTFAGNGNIGASGDGGPATAAELNFPAGLRTDSTGNLYITEVYNNNIRKVSNGKIAAVAGNSNNMGFGGDGGAATNASLNNPNGVAVDSHGNIFIADVNNNRVRMVSASTGFISTIAGNGDPGYSGDGGPAISAELSGPWDVVVTSTGSVLVADSLGHVRVLTPTTSTCTFTGIPGTLPVSADGGNQTIAVQTTAFCAWGISGLPSWITLGSPSYTTGSGSAILAVAANTGGARSATITVAGQSVSVNQAAAGSPSPCDINQDGVVNVVDVQLLIKQSLGLLTAANDLDGNRAVNVVDVQIDSDAVLQLGCLAK